MFFIHAAFTIDWVSAGGSSFIELASGVNLAFVAWDNFQERLKFVDRDCREIVRQACADIIDDDLRENSEEHFQSMLANVDNTYKWLWGICYLFGLAMVFSGFVMLYFNWSCRHNYLLLLPIVSYLLGSGIIWLHFWKSCKSHCKAIEIASGKKATSDKQEVDKMAKGIEAELQPTGETVNDASSPKTTKKKSRPL